VLLELGFNKQELANVDHAACQRIGGAVEWLEQDGLLVPSAWNSGVNPVIFTRKQGAEADFEIIEKEIVSQGSHSSQRKGATYDKVGDFVGARVDR